MRDLCIFLSFQMWSSFGSPCVVCLEDNYCIILLPSFLHILSVFLLVGGLVSSRSGHGMQLVGSTGGSQFLHSLLGLGLDLYLQSLSNQDCIMNGNCGRLYSSVKNYTIFNLEMGGDAYIERERFSIFWATIWQAYLTGRKCDNCRYMLVTCDDESDCIKVWILSIILTIVPPMCDGVSFSALPPIL